MRKNFLKFYSLFASISLRRLLGPPGRFVSDLLRRLNKQVKGCNGGKEGFPKYEAKNELDEQIHLEEIERF